MERQRFSKFSRIFRRRRNSRYKAFSIDNNRYVYDCELTPARHLIVFPFLNTHSMFSPPSISACQRCISTPFLTDTHTLAHACDCGVVTDVQTIRDRKLLTRGSFHQSVHLRSQLLWQPLPRIRNEQNQLNSDQLFLARMVCNVSIRVCTHVCYRIMNAWTERFFENTSHTLSLFTCTHMLAV